MSMQVILLERVDNLGDLGEVVKVKPGYARNYLIPESKALRATDDNIAYFESQKKEIEKKNEARRKDAEKEAKKLEGLLVAMVRHASESGQLYGSVTARDIAEVVSETSGLKIGRSMVTLNDSFKMIGLFPVSISLHPEVKVDVTINVARSIDEAKIQEKSGKALVAENEDDSNVVKAEADAKLEEASEKEKEKMLEEGALEAEKQRAEEEAQKEAESAAKAAEKAAAKEAKKLSESAEEDQEGLEAANDAEAPSDDSQAQEQSSESENEEEKKED